MRRPAPRRNEEVHLPRFHPKDPEFEARVRASFAKQTIMATLGATLIRVVPGEAAIAMPHAPHILQQHGFVHAGAVATIADSACGYAALSLMPRGAGVLTVEFKINLVAPAAGERLEAFGLVERPGRTIIVASGRVEAVTGGERRTCALIMATMMTIEGRDGVSD